MACGCGRSQDFCRGWHALSEEEWQQELAKWQQENAQPDTNRDNYTVKVTEVHHYTDKLFRFCTEKPAEYSFKAGEFAMIGLGDRVRRAYSFTSAPDDDHLEFYSIKVPDGALTSRLKNIQPGDTVEVGSKTTGTLLLENLLPGRRLWMLATGTGIAPFVSIVRDKTLFKKFPETYVTWTTRTARDQAAYKSFLSNSGLTSLFSTVTQEPLHVGYQGRIQRHIAAGTVLKNMDPVVDRVMLCGSMAFNEDIRDILEKNGFTEGNAGRPGSYVVEKAFVG